MSFLERVKRFFQPEVRYKIVEIKVPRQRLRGWDDNTRQAVISLAAHPGFVALLELLQLAKAQLETNVKYSRHKDLSEVEFLQSGIFWSGWLQEQVDKATQRGSQKQYVDPEAEELAAFKLLDAKIERLGNPNDKSVSS